MPKQIKIGHDKVPSPVSTQFPQLVDIEGNLLFDEAGNPLLTEEQGSQTTFASAKNSLSGHINNDKTSVAEVVPVSEIFPEQSAVSTNLLGYNRAEVQLSLFSDVSTYGYDVKNWNYYTFTAGLTFPREWYTRQNPLYGRRQQPNFFEETDEQALYLKSYPVQYSYPFGPSWEREGSGNRYNESFFPLYLNFIAMGKFLYDLFVDDYPVFAKRNFISGRINIVQDWENDPDGFYLENTSYAFDPNAGLSSGDGFGVLSLANPDINYGTDEQQAYDDIEAWTFFWQQIIDGTAVFPTLTGNPAPYNETNEYFDLQEFARTQTRPGYSDTVESFSVLESKNSFRYQPGRASGFTFGVRAKTDGANLNNYIEWGAANETDEYIFQLRGSQFNIIRRSVIPLPPELIERMGLSEDAVDDEYYRIGLDSNVPVQQVTIGRDFWNGDRLNGTGPSGYTLQFENVTMYKIEFSWYGAIGAKFYAYVPAQNGEARWVLMHTLVIENGMGQPILKNPDFKFRYQIYSDRTSSVTEPFFIYKYGSSYYIDGGDEGTVRLSSVTSDSKPVSPNGRTPLVGLLPKSNILSSYRGTEVDNEKKLYPDSVSVNVTEPTRIDIEEIQGSSDGFHHHYSPGLEKSAIGERIDLKFNSNGTELSYANNDAIDTSNVNSKVIADGLYNVYVGNLENTFAAKVERRSTDGIYDYILSERPVGIRSVQNNGTIIEPREGGTINARLTKYDFAASTIPIKSEKFTVHFLNPEERDSEYGNRHYSDFLIGISQYEPYIDGIDNKLRFDQGGLEEEYNEGNTLEDKLFVEWSHYSERINSFGQEELEWDPPYGSRMEIDARLRNDDEPLGEGSGRISAVIGEVNTFDIAVDSISAGTNEGIGQDYTGLYKITFKPDASVPITVFESSLGTGELGINGLGSGIIIAGPDNEDDERTFFGLDGNQYYVYVTSDPGNPSSVQVRSVTLRSPWILDSFDQDGNERFERQKWQYSRAYAFDILPLYIVVGLRDEAKINNIVVEEERPDGTLTHTPQWITGSNSGISVTTTGNGESPALGPSNFTAETRLQGSLFDIQTTQPMRPGEVIYSFFVDPSKPEKINLSNVFNFDRRNVSTGLYNNKGYFFTASPVGANTGTAEMTLTVKEQ